MDIWETYAPAGLGLGFLVVFIFLLGRTATSVAHGYSQSTPIADLNTTPGASLAVH